MPSEQIELLSPAGTLEAGIAAFAYGADAVYLGMKSFSARADAGNFTQEELATLLDVAHGDLAHPRKVYVAVNTLVREAELPALVEFLAHLDECDVDALIVQDLAVAKLCREHFPNLKLHASTQMAVHNAEGVRTARKLGFTRVVAAREVTIQELEEMSRVEGMEIEAFLHGALCYSYSGLCLLSALLHGTSGNRGDCSYVCRNRFSFAEMENPPQPCCPMSMKDLALGEQIPALRRAGVVSLKIEGRKKTPLYVAAVTNYYRKWIDGSFAPGEQRQCESDVRTIFSRPWTKLYAQTITNKDVTDPHTTGPRGVECGSVSRVIRRREGDFLRFTVLHQPIEKHDGLQIELQGKTRPFGFGIDDLRQFPQNGDDRWERVFVVEPGRSVEIPLPADHPEIPHGSKIFHTSSQEIKRRYHWAMPRVTSKGIRRVIDVTVEIKEHEVCASVDDQISSQMEAVPFAKAQDVEKMELSVRRSFERLGDTCFQLGKLVVHNPLGLFVPASLLNQLRRTLTDRMEIVREDVFQKKCEEITYAIARTEPAIESKPTRIVVKLPTAQIPDWLRDRKEIAEFVLPLRSRGDCELVEEDSRVRWSIPVICRGNGRARLKEALESAVARNFTKWEVGNLGALALLEEYGAGQGDVVADWPLYVCNHLAADLYFQCGIRQVTACPEDSLQQQLLLAEKLGSRYRVVLWQEPLAARSATCLMASARGMCPGPRSCHFTHCLLTNPRGESLRAVNEHCQTNFYLTEPLDFRAQQPLFQKSGTVDFCFDFSSREFSEEEISRIMGWKG